MKRRWKILIGICGSLVALVGFGAVYIFTANPPPAEIVNAGPTGEKVNKDGVFGNFFPAMADKPRPAILVLGGSEGGWRQMFPGKRELCKRWAITRYTWPITTRLESPES